ncbi:MAG: hypothetical protein C0621_08160 [Desulfuromonas sp.]|nr:MAG: hypothetical protein C0621_08160 [Desulfuromonas sp.]
MSAQEVVRCCRGRFVLPLLFLLLLSGCLGERQALDNVATLLHRGEVNQALVQLDESSLAKGERNRLLYLWEKGLLLHLQGKYRQSNDVLEEADLLEEELMTRSLSAEALSFVSNDTIIPYRGEDYEAAYANYYRALNYLALGELDEALVECRRVDEKLTYYTNLYEGEHVFKESPYLRLLTGLVYEADGDSNNAFIAYRRSLEAYQFYRDKYHVAIPDFLWSRLVQSARATGFESEAQRYEKKARESGVVLRENDSFLVILVDRGILPRKQEKSFAFTSPDNVPVKLALPYYPHRERLDPLRVKVKNRPVRFNQGENLYAVAKQSLEDKKGRILVKAIARAAAKQLAARKAENELGPLAGFASKMVALITEQADLRGWSSLPQRIDFGVVALPPGEYEVRFSSHRENRDLYAKVPERGPGFLFTRSL